MRRAGSASTRPWPSSSPSASRPSSAACRRRLRGPAALRRSGQLQLLGIADVVLSSSSAGSATSSASWSAPRPDRRAGAAARLFRVPHAPLRHARWCRSSCCGRAACRPALRSRLDHAQAGLAMTLRLRSRDQALRRALAVDGSPHLRPGRITPSSARMAPANRRVINMCAGSYKRERGRIRLDERRAAAPKKHRIAQAGRRAHLPEHPPVRRHDRAAEHRGLPLPRAVRPHLRRGLPAARRPPDEARAAERCRAHLARFDLDHRPRSWPATSPTATRSCSRSPAPRCCARRC